MDAVFDILFTLVLDGGFEIINSKKISYPIRVTILTLLTVFYIALTVVFICISIKCDNILSKTLFVLISLFFVFLFTRLWWKLLHNK